jgi:hypothetical protein
MRTPVLLNRKLYLYFRNLTFQLDQRFCGPLSRFNDRDLLLYSGLQQFQFSTFMLSQNAFSRSPQIPTTCPPQINGPHSLWDFGLWEFRTLSLATSALCPFVTSPLHDFGPSALRLFATSSLWHFDPSQLWSFGTSSLCDFDTSSLRKLSLQDFISFFICWW